MSTLTKRSVILNQVDSSGEVIVLPVGGCPWKEHVMCLETELQLQPPIKFVLYSDSSNKWRVQCVPKDKNSFENRCFHGLYEQVVYLWFTRA